MPSMTRNPHTSSVPGEKVEGHRQWQGLLKETAHYPCIEQQVGEDTPTIPELCKLGACVSLSEIFVYLWICVGRNNLGCSLPSLGHHSYLCPIPHCSINFWYHSAILQRRKEVIKLIYSAAMLIRHVYMIMPNGIMLCLLILLRPRMIIIIRKFS